MTKDEWHLMKGARNPNLVPPDPSGLRCDFPFIPAFSHREKENRVQRGGEDHLCSEDGGFAIRAWSCLRLPTFAIRHF
jgi:hypothetical protein